MKRSLTVLSLILFLSPCTVIAVGDVSVSYDIASLFLIKEDSFTVPLECSLEISDSVRCGIGVAYSRAENPDASLSLFSLNATFDYFPFEGFGFYTGCTLLGYNYASSTDLDGHSLFTSQLRFGYRHKFFRYLCVDLRLTVNDAVKASEQDYQIVSSMMGSMSRYRLTLAVGATFDIFNKDKKEKESND